MLNHLGAAPAGTRARSAQAARWLMQVLRPFPAPPLWALAPPSRAGALSPPIRKSHFPRREVPPPFNFPPVVRPSSLILPDSTFSTFLFGPHPLCP